ADTLRKVFSQQYLRRGDWPQWFMFPPFEQIQSPQCHGDVLIWPLKALCDYLEHTNDAAILHQSVPYTDDTTFQPAGQPETILKRGDGLVEPMPRGFLSGFSFRRCGQGDWDDSFQSADPRLGERAVSSWTAELMFQTLRRYAEAMSRFGEDQRAARAS